MAPAAPLSTTAPLFCPLCPDSDSSLCRVLVPPQTPRGSREYTQIGSTQRVTRQVPGPDSSGWNAVPTSSTCACVLVLHGHPSSSRQDQAPGAGDMWMQVRHTVGRSLSQWKSCHTFTWVSLQRLKSAITKAKLVIFLPRDALLPRKHHFPSSPLYAFCWVTHALLRRKAFWNGLEIYLTCPPK